MILGNIDNSANKNENLNMYNSNNNNFYDNAFLSGSLANQNNLITLPNSNLNTGRNSLTSSYNQINNIEIDKSINNMNDNKNQVQPRLLRLDSLNGISKQDSLKKLSALNSCFNCNEINDTIICFSCKNKVCRACTGICKSKKSSEHLNQNQIFCKDCIKLCFLCGKNSQCLDCSKKCFSKECKNYYCSICIDKNKHQQRTENTNCRFYKCESCNTDSNCIMSTIYCSLCDRRICRNCLSREHINHISFN